MAQEWMTVVKTEVDDQSALGAVVETLKCMLELEQQISIDQMEASRRAHKLREAMKCCKPGTYTRVCREVLGWSQQKSLRMASMFEVCSRFKDEEVRRLPMRALYKIVDSPEKAEERVDMIKEYLEESSEKRISPDSLKYIFADSIEAESVVDAKSKEASNRWMALEEKTEEIPDEEDEEIDTGPLKSPIVFPQESIEKLREEESLPDEQRIEFELNEAKGELISECREHVRSISKLVTSNRSMAQVKQGNQVAIGRAVNDLLLQINSIEMVWVD